jgi:pimeloyl-ACP methyl ester carboxylesterase
MIESLQGRLIFGKTTRIRPLQPGPLAGAYRIEAHRLERPDGAMLEGWSSRPAEGPVDAVVLYFGGRNENVVWVADMASFNPRHAIYAFNYRGFGNSTGRASERRAKADASAIHAFVAARESMRDLAIVGRSLGTGVALALAREARPDRLVLMSPFESVPRVLRTRPMTWPVAAVVTQRFACVELARGFAGHALMLLAERDDTIPHAQSLRLAAQLPNKPCVEIVAGTTHQTLPRSGGAQRAIAAFLDAAGRPTSRRP